MHSTCSIVHYNRIGYNLAVTLLLFKNASTALKALFEHCWPGQGPSSTSSDSARLSNWANDGANFPR